MVRFLDQFIDWAHSNLLESDLAMDYLMSRGCSREQMTRHRLGFVNSFYEADETLDSNHSETCEDREKKNLHCDSCRFRRWFRDWECEEYDKSRLEGSLVFPMLSYSGACMSIQCRNIEKKEFEVFGLKNRAEACFFGLHPNLSSIWSSRKIHLVEGAFDFLVLERLITRDCSALMTNSVNKLQTRFLLRFVDEVCMCLDADKAGRDGVRSFLHFHGNDFRITSIQPPPGFKDLNEFWTKAGDQKFVKHFGERG